MSIAVKLQSARARRALDGRIALVTGSTIGLGIVRALADDSWTAH